MSKMYGCENVRSVMFQSMRSFCCCIKESVAPTGLCFSFTRYRGLTPSAIGFRPFGASSNCGMFVIAALMLLANSSATVFGDEVTSREVARLVQKGNDALAEGKYQDAMAAYDEAKMANPESPEVAYNRGIALYRLGQYDAAQKALQDALKPDRPDLEARVKYNLGRSAHEAAIAGRDKLDEAVNSLGKAVSFYKDALTLNSKDEDARRNMEQAERLRVFLEKKLKEKQEQKKENSSSQPTSQPKDETTSQPDEKQQPSSQPSSQPDDQKGEEDEKGDDEKKDQKGENQKEQKGDKKGKDEQEGESKQGEEKKEGEDSSAEQDQEKQSKLEEVEPMLQEARDAEKARREAKRARMMRVRGKVPVKKDW